MRKKSFTVFVLMAVLLVLSLALPAMAKATKAEIAKVQKEMAAFNAKIVAADAREKAAGVRAFTARKGAAAAKAEAVAAGKAVDVARAKAEAAGKIAAEAMARQDAVMNVVTLIPGPGWIIGHFASWHKAGEMSYADEYIRAVRSNQPRPAGNETSRGLSYAFFKGLSTAPEGIAFYGVGRTLQLLKHDQLDPYSVWTAYGRPYWLDFTVIGAKAAGGVMGAYAGDVGLPILRPTTEPVQSAFVYMAMMGGSWNVVSGTASQAFQGAKPFQKYYDMHHWWTGRSPL